MSIHIVVNKIKLIIFHKREKTQKQLIYRTERMYRMMNDQTYCLKFLQIKSLIQTILCKINQTHEKTKNQTKKANKNTNHHIEKWKRFQTHSIYRFVICRSQGSATYLNGASHRRPQSLMSPAGVDRNKVDEIELTITIQKDACIGYGMKVFSLYFFFVFRIYYYFFAVFLCMICGTGENVQFLNKL